MRAYPVDLRGRVAADSGTRAKTRAVAAESRARDLRFGHIVAAGNRSARTGRRVQALMAGAEVRDLPPYRPSSTRSRRRGAS
jgi:hypothetical protein